jgi:predicted nucleotidyltransferase
MPQQELLRQVVRALEETRCAYMLTGSFASSLQGEPRLSHDIDLVVEIRPESIPAFVGRFPATKYHLDEEAIRQAVRTRGMFNLLHMEEGDKVDFWMVTDEPFDVSRFGRRRKEEVLGMSLDVSTPEDTILAKLRWGKSSGGSDKQFHDALRVFQVQSGALDLTYLHRWVAVLGLEEEWARVQKRAAEELL